MDHIFLIGMMGVGKTTVGRKLADLLKREFIDMDQELMRRTGATISHIFEMEGEEGFRQRETRLLREICTGGQAVVSTGGGIVTRPENRTLMNAAGRVCYLDMSADALWERLKHSRKRPLLQVENPRERLEELRAERKGWYQQTADHRILVSSDTSALTARRIREWLASTQVD